MYLILKITKYSLIILLWVIFSNFKVKAQSELYKKDFEASPYAKFINKQQLLKNLSVLTADSLEGRETGTIGAEKASRFIAKNFKDFGLKAIVNKPELGTSSKSYFFPIPLKQWVSQNGTLQIGNLTLQSGKDFIPVSRDGFLGQEILQDSLLIGIQKPSDTSMDFGLKGEKVEGKILFLTFLTPDSGNISFKKNTDVYNYFRKLRLELKKISAKKPRAIFLNTVDIQMLSENEFYKGIRTSPQMGFDPKGAVKPLGIFLIQTDAFNKILAGNNLNIQTISSSTFYSISLQKVNLEIPLLVSDVSASDVIGFMEGTDLKEEVLILSAHYDHLGKHNGQIYHGADDDGSGSAALVNLALAFSKAKKAGHGPRRSILFLANVGEEKGLLGSYYYSEHPVIPIKNTIADLNIDMIGRVDEAHIKDSAYVYVIGSGKLSSDLQFISEGINKQFSHLNLDYTYDSPSDPNQFYYRSDHYNFARLGVPIIFYFNGVHADYHQPSDTIEKINFGIYAKRAQLVFFTAWDLANRENKPKVDRKSDFSTRN